MKRACSKCGKIHDRNFICESNNTAQSRAESIAYSFRNRQVWKRKSEEIRERDLNLCQICVRGLYSSRKRLNSRGLSVHHIIPLVVDYDKRLDNANLITLCSYHHELAEGGRIPANELLKLAAEQEQNAESIPPTLLSPKSETP